MLSITVNGEQFSEGDMCAEHLCHPLKDLQSLMDCLSMEEMVAPDPRSISSTNLQARLRTDLRAGPRTRLNFGHQANPRASLWASDFWQTK